MILGIQAVVVLVLLEGAARVLDPLGISYYPETARYLDTLVLEEPIGYRHRPGLSGMYYGVPVTINSIGLRDREIPEPKGREIRILAMGDSVPFGIGARQEDTYPSQLETRLNEKFPGRNYRTINMGVPSYNTEQELTQLKTLGLRLQPDLVTLLFSNNDIEPKLWVFEKRRTWYVNLVQRSYAGSLLYVLFRNFRQSLTAHAASMPPGSGLPVDAGVAFGEYRLDSPRWLAIDHSLTELHTLLRARRIPFVLFTNNEFPVIREMLDGVARREGFPLVHLDRRTDPRWAGQDERLFHNSVTDQHPSALGNRVLAIQMAENLEKLKLLAP